MQILALIGAITVVYVYVRAWDWLVREHEQINEARRPQNRNGF